jgi:hypothetical protein
MMPMSGGALQSAGAVIPPTRCDIRPPRSFSTRLDEKAEEARRAIERVGKLDAL